MNPTKPHPNETAGEYARRVKIPLHEARRIVNQAKNDETDTEEDA